MKNFRSNVIIKYCTFCTLCIAIGCESKMSPSITLDTNQLKMVEFQVIEKLETLAKTTINEPRSEMNWAEYAMTLDIHDFKSKATIAYKQAAIIDPNDFRWPFFCAIIYHDIGDIESLQWYEKCLSIKSDYAPAINMYGKALDEFGDINSSKKVFYKALDIDPCSKMALNHLIKIHFREYNNHTADSLLQVVKNCGKTDRIFYGLMSELYRRKGDMSLSLVFTKEAHSLPKENTITNPLYDQVISRGVSSGWYRYRAQRYIKNKLFKLAIKEYKELIRIHSISEDYYNLAFSYEEIGDIQKAEQHYMMCIRSDPNFINAYKNLAGIYKTKGDNEKYLFYHNQFRKIGSKDDI